MDQENTLDFKALRAKFQDEETLVLRQPRTKPSVPEKPRTLPPPQSPTYSVPPPQSPTHTLPAGARPSLLSTINQAADSKSILAPRVIFKEDKKEAKKPLIQPKSKEKVEGKTWWGKAKNGGVKEAKGEQVEATPEKKEADATKHPTEEKKKKKKTTPPELVAATPPPKTATPKKKGFLGFKRSSKKEVPAESILDTPSPDVEGIAALMPTNPAPVDPAPLDPAPVDPISVDPTPKLKEALLPPNYTLEEPPAVSLSPPTPVTATPEDLPPQVPTSLPPSPTPPLKTEIPAKVLPALPVSVSPSPRTPTRVTSLLPHSASSPPSTPPLSVSSTPPPPVISTPSTPPPPVPSTPPPPVTFTPPPTAVPTPPPTAVPTPPPTAVPTPPPVLEPEPEVGIEAGAEAGVEAGVETEAGAETGVEAGVEAVAEAGAEALVEAVAEALVEAVAEAMVEAVAEAGPPVSSLAVDPPSRPHSPRPERPLSALSALGRAEEMGMRRTSSCDPRVLSALEKARRKITSPGPSPSPTTSSPTPTTSSPTPTTSIPGTPTTEEPSPPAIPPFLPTDLPPIDYQEQTAQVNDINHRQPSPALEGIAEEEANIIPELLVVPPPPPRRALPSVESQGPPPDKPARPPRVDLPPLDQSAVEIHAPPPQFCEEESVPQQEEEILGSDTLGSEALDESFAELQTPGLMEPIWGSGEAVVPVEEAPPGAVEQEVEHEANPPGQQDQEVQECGVELKNGPGDHQPSDSASSPGSPVERPEIEEVPAETKNVSGDVHTSGKQKSKTLGVKKRSKGPPKNPYAETQPANEESHRNSWFSKNEKKAAPEGPDEKELKKREKQRLEKEKKEQKEQREREKKEQKEREKKENEMKKKFKITGQEEAMYQATVTVTTKGRKRDLALNSGDIISIIRTTNCPKGKWLARDSSNTFGYVSVSHVELDVKEMMELGKKAACNRNSSTLETERTSAGSRNSASYPLSTGSFSDDSEEWTADDDEMFSTPIESTAPGLDHATSMLEDGSREHGVHPEHTTSDVSTESVNQQSRHEALQKLSTFFHAPRDTSPPAEEQLHASPEPETSPEFVPADPDLSSVKEVDPLLPDMIILPPPDLYADIFIAE